MFVVVELADEIVLYLNYFKIPFELFSKINNSIYYINDKRNNYKGDQRGSK